MSTTQVSGRIAEYFAHCGAHYKLCPVEIREFWTRIASSPAQAMQFKELLRKHAHSHDVELVTVSTCNRFDLCLFGRVSEEGVIQSFREFAEKALSADDSLLPSELQKHVLSADKIRSYLRFYFDKDALHMLFRVSASLDSLVLGEPHILGQLKSAYAEAQTHALCGAESHLVFNRCFQVAKRVRSETDLGKNGISVGHAAVEASRRIYDNLKNVRALVLGAGEMGRIVAQHFIACGVEHLTIANRTQATASQLAAQLGPEVEAWDLPSALKSLAQFDVIVVATSAQEPIVRREHALPFAKKRTGQPVVIVDICVPRNVEASLAKEDNLFVFDIDDLDRIMESNREARKAAAMQAEAIISVEVDVFLASRKQRENLAGVGRYHTWVRQTVEHEVRRSLRGTQTTQGIQISPQIIADAVAKKLVAHAASLARADARTPAGETVGWLFEFLFNLSAQPLEQADAATVIPLQRQPGGAPGGE